MSLVELSQGCYAFLGAVNMGVVVGEEGQVLLIDSGLDAQNARKALRPFLERGMRLAAILNTHSHADHCGGNAELVRRFGAAVYAPPLEDAFVQHPVLEPMFLYGGALPPGTLRVKFLEAPASPVQHRLPPAGPFTVAGRTLEVIPVPGHAMGQVALAIGDVVYAADGFFQPDVLARHPLNYLVDVGQALRSLESLQGRRERWLLPGHGALVDQGEGGDPLPAILGHHADTIRATTALIHGLLQEPMDTDALLYAAYAHLGVHLNSDPQYHLDRATLLAHLSYLEGTGHVRVGLETGRRLWHRI